MNASLLSLLLAGSLSAQPAAPQTIDAEILGQRTSVAVAELGRLSGLDLRVSSDVGEDVIFVVGDDVPIDLLLRKVAEVTVGSWRREPSGALTLQPDIAERGRQDRTRGSNRAQKIQKDLSEYRKFVLDQLGEFPDEAGREAIRRSSYIQGQNLALSLFEAFGVERLARIETGDRIVLSTNPTRMQLPMPGGAAAIAPIIEAHRVEEQARIEAEREAAANGEPVPDGPDLEFLTALGIDMRPKRLTGEPGKALAILSRRGEFAFLSGPDTPISLEIVVFDREGKVGFEMDYMLGQLDFPGAAMMATEENQAGAEGTPPPPPPDTSPEIDYGPESRDFSEVERPLGGPVENVASLLEFRAKLLRPDLKDPLSYGNAEALALWSKTAKKPLIAVLPDSLSASTVIKGATTLGQYKKVIENEVSLDENGEFIVVVPKEPALARQKRGDRLALARLVQAAAEYYSPPLTELAAYAVNNPEPWETPVLSPYFALLAPNAIASSLGGVTDWDLLRFVGQMTPSQWDAARRGLPISFSALTVGQRTALTRMAFGQGARIRVNPPAGTPEPVGFMRVVQDSVPAPYNDVRNEPTEIMPNGLPPAGALLLQTRSSYVVAPGGPTPQGMEIGSIGLDELALVQTLMESPMAAQMAGEMPDFTRLRIGERTELRLEFALVPGVYMQYTLNDDRLRRDTPAVSASNLPADFQSALSAKLDEMKKGPNIFQMIGAMGARESGPRAAP